MTDNNFYYNKFIKKNGQIIKIDSDEVLVASCDCCFEKIMSLRLIYTENNDVHYICDYCVRLVEITTTTTKRN